MITYENAVVLAMKVAKDDEYIPINVALVYENEQDDKGRYFISVNGALPYRICVQLNVLRTLAQHPELMNEKGVFKRIPVEVYTDQCQTVANNRLYCFAGRQNILLKNMEFCEILANKFGIDVSTTDAVSAIEEELQKDTPRKQLFVMAQKLKANTFLDIRAINLFRAVFSFRSKYVPRQIINCLKELKDIYPDATDRELFFDAMACLNSTVMQRKIMNLKKLVYKNYIKDGGEVIPDVSSNGDVVVD